MALSPADRTRLARLADPIKVHREMSSDGLEALRAALYDAHQAGASERELATASGYSSSHVHRIIVEEARRRQPVVLEEQEG
jgi:hypothetical protein